MHSIRTDAQDRMLFAVDNFDESHAVNADGTSRDNVVCTEEFFNALAEWAPVALVGDFSMTTDTSTGEINITFAPK